MTIFGLQARTKEDVLQGGRKMRTGECAEEPKGVSCLFSQLSDPHSLPVVSERFPSILSTQRLLFFAHLLGFLLCAPRTTSTRAVIHSLLKAHLSRCLDFTSHTTPGRKHGRYQQQHLMAKEAQATTHQPLKVSQEGRQSLTQTQHHLYHAPLTLKVCLQEKGHWLQGIIERDVLHS